MCNISEERKSHTMYTVFIVNRNKEGKNVSGSPYICTAYQLTVIVSKSCSYLLFAVLQGMKNWMILDKYFSKNGMTVLFDVAAKCGEVLLFWKYFDVNLIFQTWHICGKGTINFSIVAILFSHVVLFCMLFI
jgi:hypothetical protein